MFSYLFYNHRNDCFTFLCINLTCTGSRLPEFLLVLVSVLQSSTGLCRLQDEVAMVLVGRRWVILLRPCCPWEAAFPISPGPARKVRIASGVKLTCSSLSIDWRCSIDVSRQLAKLLCSAVHFMNFYPCQLALWQYHESYLFFFLTLSSAYSAFTAVAFLEHMMDQGYLLISIGQWDQTLRS